MFDLLDQVLWAEQTSAIPLDIIEASDAFKVELEVPGVPRDTIKVTVEGGMLIVTGNKLAPPTTSGKVLSTERRFGSFKRTIRLNETVDVNNIDAEVTNGVLVVTLPKTKESVRYHEIEVR